jgi:hypothetical protein
MRIKDEQMQTQVLAVQLELDLWQNLATAKDEPETADILQLWQDLEQVIEQSELDQQLRVAGDAIAKIVEVYAIRANAILSSLEVHDTKTEPILSEDFLNDLIRQSMTIDLSDMMEDLFPSEPEAQALAPTRGSVVVPIDKKAAHAIAKGAKIDAKRMVTELAGNEQVSHWAEAIAQWMQLRSCGEAVSLLGLQQALGMPLVNIWLGLLLPSEHRYDWERSGEFYSDAGEILLRQRRGSN